MAILKQVDALMKDVGAAYLEAGQRLELPSMLESYQTASAEQIAVAYRDVQLRFEDLKAAVYEFGSSLLGNEHTCEQGAALIDALVHIAPDYRDSKTLQKFARSFCPAFVAFEQGEWETARKGFAMALKITPSHARATGLHRASHMIPAQDAISKEQWGAATGLLNAWLTIAPNDDEAQQLLRQSRLGLANVLIEGGKWQDAQHLLAEWLRSHPDDEEAFALQRSSYVKPAEAAIATEQWDVARTHLDAWIKILPIDGEAKNLIAEIYHRQCSRLLERGSLWQAAETYQRVSHGDRVYADRLADLPRQRPDFLWYLQKPSALRVLLGHAGAVNCVEWSPDGRWLASASKDTTIRIWNPVTGQLVKMLMGHEKEVHSVAWSTDGRWLASGSADGIVRIWDAATWQFVESLQGRMREILCVTWSPDGSQLSWCGNDPAIMICRFGSERNVLTLHDPLATTYHYPVQPEEPLPAYWSIHSLAWNPDGTQIVSGGIDGILRVWDTRTGRCFRKIVTATSEHERTDIPNMLSGVAGRVNESGRPAPILPLEQLPAEQVRFQLHSSVWLENSSRFIISDVCWTSDGSGLVSGNSFGWIKVWDSHSGRLLREVVKDRNPIVDLSYTPDSVRVALASPDRTVTVLDAQTGLVIQSLLGHTDGVTSVAWNPDASRLASASSDGTVRIWGYQ